ncbi:MAG: hypothetical protein NWP61_00545 [Rickettsiaceae bacterium]|nr:hypothetical protein [Rickettsiaceae bacterium]
MVGKAEQERYVKPFERMRGFTYLACGATGASFFLDCLDDFL